MGEAKRKEHIRKIVDTVTKEWTDQGRIIEAGFRSLLAVGYHDPDKISPEQIAEMRRVFFAGAQHLFASMLSVMDPADEYEPTEDDMRRMTLIASELDAFVEEMKATLGEKPEPRGTAQ